MDGDDAPKHGYSWSYAPTNRAKCKGKCKGKIEKGALRFASSSDGAGDYQMTTYRLLSCVTKKQFDNMTAKAGSPENVPGFDSLQPSDQEAIRAAVLAAVPPPKPAKKAKKDSGPSTAAGGTPATDAAASSPAVVAAAAAAPPAPSAPLAAAATPASSTTPTSSALPVAKQHEFCEAAKRRDWAAVKSMLDDEPGYVNAQPAGRWSALHQFAQALVEPRTQLNPSNPGAIPSASASPSRRGTRLRSSICSSCMPTATPRLRMARRRWMSRTTT